MCQSQDDTDDISIKVQVNKDMSMLEAHLNPNLICLHLDIPGFDRLLLTCLHIPQLHLISYPPSWKSLLWEDKRETKMIEVTRPHGIEELCQKMLPKAIFNWKGNTRFALCNSWVDHKKVKIANVYGTLPFTHSNGLIYRYKNHYFFCSLKHNLNTGEISSDHKYRG